MAADGSLESGFISATLCSPLEGGSKGLPQARRVFHAILVRKLETDGALTIGELSGRLYWFNVMLSELEVRQLVTSAARHGVVEPLFDPGPGSGSTAADEARWLPTELGRQLPPPGGSSFEDLGASAPGALKQVRAGLSDWATLAVGAIAVIGFGATFEANRRLGAAAVFYLFLVLWCVGGVRAERDLAAAARAWPQFKRKFPARWEWQTRPYRAETLTVGVLVAAGLCLAALVTLPGISAEICAVVAVVVAALTFVLYWLRLRPLAREWRDDAGIPGRWTQRWTRLKKLTTRLRRLRWMLKSPKTTMP